MKKSKFKKENKALRFENSTLKFKIALLELKIKMNQPPKFPSGGFVAKDKTEKKESVFSPHGVDMQVIFDKKVDLKDLKNPVIDFRDLEKHEVAITLEAPFISGQYSKEVKERIVDQNEKDKNNNANCLNSDAPKSLLKKFNRISRLICNSHL
jgi:hypothetical protein